jgi:hypothetical protein
MFGCLTGFVSRVVFLGLWIWTDRIPNAFGDVWIVPLLGLLFLPCTAVAWVLAYAPGIGVTGWGWVIVVVAFLADIGLFSSHGRQVARRRNRRTSIPA